jgi:hypothetical protein
VTSIERNERSFLIAIQFLRNNILMKIMESPRLKLSFYIRNMSADYAIILLQKISNSEKRKRLGFVFIDTIT